MKRADIHVGDELFYRRGKYGDGDKATVVSTAGYEEVGHMYRRRGEPPYRLADRGNRVLVDVHVMRHGNPYLDRKAVPLASLHGPYEATKAAEDAANDAERERQRETEAIRDAKRNEAYRLVELSTTLGLAGIRGRSDTDYEQMTVPATTLAVLLEAYAARTT